MNLGVARIRRSQLQFLAVNRAPGKRKPASNNVPTLSLNKVEHHFVKAAREHGLPVKSNGKLPTTTTDDLGQLIGVSGRTVRSWMKQGWVSKANALDVARLIADRLHDADTAMHLCSKTPADS